MGEEQRRSRRVTLNDVAEKAGVSPMTVSNVIHGKYQFVSDATRKKVEIVLKELNYERTKDRKKKRAELTHCIGFIIVDESPYFLTDPFMTHTVGGLSNYLSSHDFATAVCRTDFKKFNHTVSSMSSRVDGFCVYMTGSKEQRRKMIKSISSVNHPVVLFEETMSNQDPLVCRILQDDYGGGRMIADHLMARRVEKIVFLSAVTRWPAISERLRGLRTGCSEVAGRVKIDVVESESEALPDVQKAFGKYLDENEVPDAVVAANDQIGIAVLLYLQQKNIHVPGDILLTGFNGFDFFQYSDPVLTTVRSQAYDMGMGGGEALIMCLREKKFLRQEIVYPVTLRFGGTT